MSTRFHVDSSAHPAWAVEQMTLRDDETGSTARVIPRLGCSLYGFSATLAGHAVETFLQPDDERLPRDPEHYGAPVLFPYPNRIRHGRFTFQGREYQLDVPKGQENSIHGLVRHLPWRVVAAAGTADGARLHCAIDAADDATILHQFPFPFRCELTFLLAGPRLVTRVRATNTGDGPMPMGFGWHPYFRLPLAPSGDRRQCAIQVPADAEWDLDQSLIPTGQVSAVRPNRDFRQARELGDTTVDDVYTQVRYSDGTSACFLSDPTNDVRLTVTAGPTFREWVVYAPPTRPTICFEPYTCTTDAFNLAARGVDSGMIVLGPGEQWEDTITLDIR